jgi:hypothetical protein
MAPRPLPPPHAVTYDDMHNCSGDHRNWGSERESVEVRILSGFLESDEFDLGSGQPLCFE